MAAGVPAPGKAELDRADWIVAAHIQTDAVETAKIKDDNVTIPKVEDALLKGVLSLGSILLTADTVFPVYFPFKVTINKIRTVTTVAVDTDDTTITAKNAAGTGMTSGVVTIATSGSAAAVEDSASPSANNIIAAGAKMTLTVGHGTSSAGEAQVFLEYTRTA